MVLHLVAGLHLDLSPSTHRQRLLGHLCQDSRSALWSDGEAPKCQKSERLALPRSLLRHCRPSDTWPGRQLFALHRSLMGTLCHCVSDPCVFGLGEAWAGLVHREGWCHVSHWWRYRLGRGQERVVGILGEGGVTVASSRKSTFCSFGLGGQQSQCPETITIQAPQRRVSAGQDTLALAASIF